MIEKYIQFAIDNGFKLHDYSDYTFCLDSDIIIKPKDGYEYKVNLLNVITTNDFIEAIARWILKNWKKSYKPSRAWLTNIGGEWVNKDILLQRVTIEQAISIRDCQLEWYILTILG